MGIRIAISAETPLSDDDRDILAGPSVMMPAIANRQNLADQAEQLAQEAKAGEPLTCEALSRDDPKLLCVNEVGHAAHHEHRWIASMRSRARGLAGETAHRRTRFRLESCVRLRQ